MASSAQVIYQFLAGKGLTAPVIAGIMGNLQTESSFSSTAGNAAEGAIGIAQWEGGRRTALQQFAAQHGGSESDLNTQLNFMWSELSGPEAGVLNEIKGMTSASQVAATWDAQYERSSGAARTQRESNANTIFSTLQTSGAAGLASMGGQGVTTMSAGETLITPTSAAAGVAAMPAAKPTATDFESEIGSIGALLTSVPELNGILNKAVSGSWTESQFQNAIDNSKWYKTNSDATKQFLTLQASDPAEYASQVNNQVAKIKEVAANLGVGLPGAEATQLAKTSLYGNYSDQQIQSMVGAFYGPNNAGHANQGGQAATTIQQIKALAESYAVPVTQQQINQWTQQVLQGTQTTDGIKQSMINTASGLFPGLAAQLKDGTTTVSSIANPYISDMANLLELDPSSITIANTPLIKQALQGTSTGLAATSNGKTGQPANAATGKEATPGGAMPLWQFENQVRSDPRWGLTDNAKQATMTALHSIGQDFGFAS